MPYSKYDRYVGDGEKVHARMVKEYGPEKGERVFYAYVNKRKKDRENKSGSSAKPRPRFKGKG